MYCPKIDRTIEPQECGEIQDNECADCGNYEPFIWFMMEQEQISKAGGTQDNG